MYGKYIKEMHDKTGIDMRTLMYKWAEADQAIRIEQMKDPWKFNLLSTSLLSSPMQSETPTEPNQLYQAINRKFLSLIEEPNKEKEEQAAQNEFETDLIDQMEAEPEMEQESEGNELDLDDIDLDAFGFGSESGEEDLEDVEDEDEPEETDSFVDDILGQESEEEKEKPDNESGEEDKETESVK